LRVAGGFVRFSRVLSPDFFDFRSFSLPLGAGGRDHEASEATGVTAVTAAGRPPSATLTAPGAAPMWRFLISVLVLFPISPLVVVLQLGCLVLASIFVVTVLTFSFPS
jgi:hypothetical protein